MNINPVVKEIRPINFLFYRTEVMVSNLIHQIPVAKALFREAVKLDMHPTGPIHWHYFGFTGDESNRFTLEVCLPVASFPTDFNGNFHFKRTENFKCISFSHEAGWNEIPRSYGVMMEFMQQNNLQPVGVTRELYINVDFCKSDANVTEIQIGTQ